MLLNNNDIFTTGCVCALALDDHSRVKLKSSENDYINASLVTVTEAERAYILSQVCGLLSKCTSQYIVHVRQLCVGFNDLFVLYCHRALWQLHVVISGS